MKMLNMQKFPYIPEELVDIIADYHDYDKYCKPTHQCKFKDVLCDIMNMSEIMSTISPKIAKECWGSYSQIIYNEYMWQDDSWLSIHTNHVNEWIDFPSLLEEDNYDNDYEDNYGMVGLYDD